MNYLAVIDAPLAKILDANRESMLEVVSSHIKDVGLNGGNVIEELIAIRKMTFMLDEVEKGIKQYVMNELDTFERNEVERHSSTVKVVESAPKYDYSESSIWEKQKAIVDKETEKLKDIEKFLKSLKEKKSMLDEETGEVVECYPPSRSSSSTLRVTLS